jgi:thiol-disulfide isomerase/thioredoxin
VLALVLITTACSQPPVATTPTKETPVPEKPAVAKAYGLEQAAIPSPEPIIGSAIDEAVQDVLLGFTLSGQSIYLSDFRGQVLLVNYWSSSCLPCRAELARLQQIYQEYRLRGLEVVAVNSGETRAAIDSFLDRQRIPLTFAIAMDPQQQAGQAQGVSGVPVTILYGMDGSVVRRFTGMLGFDPALIRQDLDRMLARDR